MEFDLWTFFVDYLGGGFWIAVLLIALLIFLIMQVFGRMSRLTTMHYIMLFLFAMTVGFGIKWITILISTLILAWVWLSWKNWVGS